VPGSRVSPSGGADFKWHFTGAKGRTVRQINTPRVISPMAICWNRQPSKGGFFDSSRPLVMMCFGRRRHGTKESAIISVANLRPHNIHRSFGTATPYFFNLRNQVTQNGQRHLAYRLAAVPQSRDQAWSKVRSAVAGEQYCPASACDKTGSQALPVPAAAVYSWHG